MTEQILPFTLEEIESMVIEAVEKFFTTMIETPITFAHSQSMEDDYRLSQKPVPILHNTSSMLVGMVGFIGDINGVINLYINENSAIELTSKLLGMDHDEIESEGFEVVNDALGEASNMIVGTFKNTVCDHGHQCRMTVPSIVRGNNFTIETPDSVFRRIYKFNTLGSQFVADLTMKFGD